MLDCVHPFPTFEPSDVISFRRQVPLTQKQTRDPFPRNINRPNEQPWKAVLHDCRARTVVAEHKITSVKMTFQTCAFIRVGAQFGSEIEALAPERWALQWEKMLFQKTKGERVSLMAGPGFKRWTHL